MLVFTSQKHTPAKLQGVGARMRRAYLKGTLTQLARGEAALGWWWWMRFVRLIVIAHSMLSYADRSIRRSNSVRITIRSEQTQHKVLPLALTSSWIIADAQTSVVWNRWSCCAVNLQHQRYQSLFAGLRLVKLTTRAIVQVERKLLSRTNVTRPVGVTRSSCIQKRYANGARMERVELCTKNATRILTRKRNAESLPRILWAYLFRAPVKRWGIQIGHISHFSHNINAQHLNLIPTLGNHLEYQMSLQSRMIWDLKH